jgi:hypothetical protein
MIPQQGSAGRGGELSNHDQLVRTDVGDARRRPRQVELPPAPAAASAATNDIEDHRGGT